jgi:DNA-binding transcriptional ArsR family regulator
LSTALGALASPVRLRILRELRSPRFISEIEVAADRADGGRVASRATVREHVERLVEAGIVARRTGSREHGEGQEFVINHVSLFALSEDVRALARLQPLVEHSLPTAPLGPSPAREKEGPRLVIVRGLDEGVAFSLAPPPTPREGAWTIGRRRGAEVRLDFDPFVSNENAVVAWDGRSYRIADVPQSKNGTSVNFRRLAPDAAHVLRHGDIVGVGRSYLVFWTD